MTSSKSSMSEEEYAALKAFLGNFYRRYVIVPGVPAEFQPIAVLERDEAISVTKARRGLLQAINDCVAMTEAWNPERVAAADKELREQGALTLSELRYRFSRRFLRVLARERISSEQDYYIVRSVVDDGVLEPGATELNKLNEMIQSYENRKMKNTLQ